MTKKLQQALEFSKNAHRGQVDKAGKDYFEGHILTVVSYCKTQKEKTVAALHDVVEDTKITLDDVKTAFGEDIAVAVDYVTWRQNETYFEYIYRLACNKTARHVKMADLKHNMDLTRLPYYPKITDKDVKRQNEYQVALEYVKLKEREDAKK